MSLIYIEFSLYRHTNTYTATTKDEKKRNQNQSYVREPSGNGLQGNLWERILPIYYHLFSVKKKARAVLYNTQRNKKLRRDQTRTNSRYLEEWNFCERKNGKQLELSVHTSQLAQNSVNQLRQLSTNFYHVSNDILVTPTNCWITFWTIRVKRQYYTRWTLTLSF